MAKAKDKSRYLSEAIEGFDETDPRQRLQRREVILEAAKRTTEPELPKAQAHQRITELIAENRAALEQAIAVLKLSPYTDPKNPVIEVRKTLDELQRRSAEAWGERERFIRDDRETIYARLKRLFTEKELRQLKDGIETLRALNREWQEIDAQEKKPEMRRYREILVEWSALERMAQTIYKANLRTRPDTPDYDYDYCADDLKAYVWPSDTRIYIFSPRISCIPSLTKQLAFSTIQPAQDDSQKEAADDVPFVERRARFAKLFGQEVRNHDFLLSRLAETYTAGYHYDAEVVRRVLGANVIFANLDDKEKQIVWLREVGRSRESWLWLSIYAEHLNQEATAIETKTGKNAEELRKDIEKWLEDKKGILVKMEGGYQGMQQKAPEFDLRSFLIGHGRQFLVLLAETPLFQEIQRFTADHRIGVEPYTTNDALLAPSYYIYEIKIHREDRPEDKKKRQEWERSDDAIFDGELKKSFVNPKLFYTGSRETKILLRLMEALVHKERQNDDTRPGSALLSLEGNILETTDFAEALARKLWMMERKWRSLTDKQKLEWLHGRLVDGRNDGNIINLAARNGFAS